MKRKPKPFRPLDTSSLSVEASRAAGCLIGGLVAELQVGPEWGEEATVGWSTLVLAGSVLRCDVVDEEDLAAALRTAAPPAAMGVATETSRFPWTMNAQEHGEHTIVGLSGREIAAASRVAPVAIRYFDDTAVLLTQARRSARVAHAGPMAQEAAVAQAAALAAAIDGCDPLYEAARTTTDRPMRDAIAQAGLFAGREGVDGDRLRLELGADTTVATTTAVALALGAGATTYEEAVRASATLDPGGAQMAGALAGARFGVTGIPAEWIARLTAIEDLHERALELAARLIARALSPNTMTMTRSTR